VPGGRVKYPATSRAVLTPCVELTCSHAMRLAEVRSAAKLAKPSTSHRPRTFAGCAS
jgi:hypothetical protein